MATDNCFYLDKTVAKEEKERGRKKLSRGNLVT